MDLGVQESIVRRYFSQMNAYKSFQPTQNANVVLSFAHKNNVELSFTFLHRVNSLKNFNRSRRKKKVSMIFSSFKHYNRSLRKIKFSMIFSLKHFNKTAYSFYLTITMQKNKNKISKNK